jgi:hypothetical protein
VLLHTIARLAPGYWQQQQCGLNWFSLVELPAAFSMVMGRAQCEVSVQDLLLRAF